MTPRYYCGTALNAPVRPAQASSFRELVDRYISAPVPIPITQDEFHRLTKEERDKKKQVDYITPATFNAPSSQRNKANALHCNLIFIDVDSDAGGLAGNPQLLLRQLAPFNFCVYHTASSLPGAPRVRVMVDAEAIPLEVYPDAVCTIARRLGIVKPTTESKVCVQPMYRPTVFSDHTDGSTPWIVGELENGRSFTVADLDGVTVPVSQYQQRVADPSDDLFFLRSTLPVSLSMVEEMLKHVDPDCDRATWLKVCAALKHQFGSGEQAEDAYIAFDNWSAQGSKYADEDDTGIRWKSFTPDGTGRLPVTIRTVMSMAREGGWDDTRANEVCFDAVETWIKEGRHSKAAFLRDGLQRIAALPNISASDEGSLLELLKRKHHAEHGLTVNVNALKADLSAVRKKAQAEQDQESRDNTGWVREFCYISSTNKFYCQSKGSSFTPEAFNRTYGRLLCPTEEQLIAAGKQVTEAAKSRPLVEPADFATNLVKITVVDDKDYDPSQPGEIYITDPGNGKKYVNTYRRKYPNPDAARAEIASKVMLGHLEKLIFEPEYRTIMLDWMAYVVQHPGEKIRWSPMIQGVEGCGKTVMGVVLGYAIGGENMRPVNGEVVSSGWNDWATGFQIVMIEEVYFGDRSDRNQVMNIIKELITNDTITINEKNENSRSVKNRTNYILLSNHHNALTVTPGDRRYFIVKSAMQTKAQVEALGENYFNNLHRLLRENAGGLRHFFENWQISPEFNPNGHAPMTKYRNEMINDSASELTATVRRLLLEADTPLVQFDLLSESEMIDLLRLNGLNRFSSQSLRAVLHEEGYEMTPQRVRVVSDGTEVLHYVWTHKGIGCTDPEATLNHRVEHGLKNLQMEMML